MISKYGFMTPDEDKIKLQKVLRYWGKELERIRPIIEDILDDLKNTRNLIPEVVFFKGARIARWTIGDEETGVGDGYYCGLSVIFGVHTDSVYIHVIFKQIIDEREKLQLKKIIYERTGITGTHRIP